MRFDLTDLRVFLHACEGGSMTQAAARSHLTLAAVSARIRSLEDAMGVALLARHPRGVKATSAGALLARHAALVFHQLGALDKDLRASSGGASEHRPTVLLGNSSALGRPLAEMLAGVMARHPQARVTVRESASEVTVQALQTGAADLGLISDAADAAGLVSIDLGPDPLLVVAPPHHPLAQAPSLDFEDLLQQDWIGWSEGGALHTHLAMRAFQAGEPIRARLTVPASQEMLDLVGQGLGIGVLPSALASHPPCPIVTVPLNDGWARRRLRLCHRPGLDDPIALALVAAISSCWSAPHPGACRSSGSPGPSRPPAPAPTRPRTS